jgi:hypothetical protein
VPRSADRRLLALALGPPLGLGALLLALAPAQATAPAYPDLPAPAHTGGFGEPTCQTCHFDNDLNTPDGSLTVEGWPETPEPGAEYPLTVRLEHPEMATAGFQLAIRTPEGEQAGTLAPGDGRSAVAEGPGGIVYLHHTEPGTALTTPGASEWGFVWVAPERISGLRLHVAANAANGDASAFGDFIYADSLSVSPLP